MDVRLLHERPKWEIFCQVVDNFGDIGVCLRIARDLADRDGKRVRLWVDDWTVLGRLCPAAAAADPGRGVEVDGVVFRHWVRPFPDVVPGEIVIEAFACELPEVHLQAMAKLAERPVWINLEYLSAEDWVAGCHGLASPHPRLPLVKHFFFPGFDEASGGLPRETGLIGRRERFRSDPAGMAAWRAERGLGSLADDTLWISLFAYEQAALPGLLEAWQQGTRPVALLVPESRILGNVAAGLGLDTLHAGQRIERGRLTTCVLPFTDQAGYDALLWSCALNFVRGEDSFVRAQWAAVPLVWQIYAQQDDAHLVKLEAFLARYCHGLEEGAAAALGDFWRAWNGADDIAPGQAWHALEQALPVIAGHARCWSDRLASTADLASRLTKFCFHIRGAAR